MRRQCSDQFLPALKCSCPECPGVRLLTVWECVGSSLRSTNNNKRFLGAPWLALAGSHKYYFQFGQIQCAIGRNLDIHIMQFVWLLICSVQSANNQRLLAPEGPVFLVFRRFLPCSICFGRKNCSFIYSWPNLVVPYTEELFSRPFVDEN